MEKSTRYLAVVSLFSLLALTLYACGGGGGGGGTPAQTQTPVEPLSVSGTVTDSDRNAVSGATVTIYNSSGTTAATTTTDAGGNYEVRGLAAGVYSMATYGAAGTFPTELYDIDLTSGTPPSVDIYLPSTSPALESTVDIFTEEGPLANISMATAQLDISNTDLTGTSPSVYIKGINVQEFGTGQASEVFVPFPAAVDPTDYITRWYASTAVEIVGVTIDPLVGPAILQLPVPTALQASASAEASPAPLFRLDEATMAWLQVDADAVLPGIDDPAVLDGSNEFYTADVYEGGLYRVGVVDQSTAQVTGSVVFQDGTSAVPGATVYLNGKMYGYQQVLTTDAAGNFSGFALDGMDLDISACRKQGGVLACTTLTEAVGIDPHALAAPIALPIDPGTTVTYSLVPDIVTGVAEVGIDGASGRIYTDTNDISDYADIAFGVSTLDFLPAPGGDGVDDFTAYAPTGTINGSSTPVLVTGPQTLTVTTADGHTVVASVANLIDNGASWDVTFSIAFAP